jgi:hypothetical protein
MPPSSAIRSRRAARKVQRDVTVVGALHKDPNAISEARSPKGVGGMPSWDVDGARWLVAHPA